MESTITKVDKQMFSKDLSRYELRKGTAEGAPLCPYGNHFEWIGFDLKDQVYVRFTKSVFQVLVNEMGIKKQSQTSQSN